MTCIAAPEPLSEGET